MGSPAKPEMVQLHEAMPHEPPPYSPNAPHMNGEQFFSPVITQPMPNINVNPMSMSPQQQAQIVATYPPGLEYLSMIDQLLINQTVEMLEVFTGFETANKYVVKNSIGQMVYFAREESDCCSRNCCGSRRKLEFRIVDTMSRQVINLKRPFACQSCLCPCWLQKVEVSSPPGVAIGYIEQNWNPIFPSFSIKNASDDVVLTIKGPFWTSSCCCSDVKFRINSANGSVKVGKIYKQWSGVAKEAFTDADNFVITFPMDLDVRIKAVLLGAVFLIDMMYFEASENKNKFKVQNENGMPSVSHQYKCCCCCPAVDCGSISAQRGFGCCCCC